MLPRAPCQSRGWPGGWGRGWGASGPALSGSLEPLACSRRAQPSGRGKTSSAGWEMGGRAPDLSRSGAQGSTIAPGAATLWLKRLPGQQLGPVSTNPWQRLGGGGRLVRKGVPSPCTQSYIRRRGVRGVVWLPCAVPPVHAGEGHRDAEAGLHQAWVLGHLLGRPDLARPGHACR